MPDEVTRHPWERIGCLQGDITRQQVDAIVNAANTRLRGGGGVDGAIHRAAGPGLLRECVARYPEGCPTGEARITGGYDLPARHVIHTVGPIFQDGAHGEPERLASCFHQSVALAAEHDLKTLAFPAISTGVYAYPVGEAAEVSLRALGEALHAHPSIESARMVLFSEELLVVFSTCLRRLARPD